MSILSFVFDNEWSQRADINRLHDQSTHLATRLERSRTHESTNEGRIAELEREVGELAMITKILTELVVQNGLCTPEELGHRIQSANLEEGVVDGMMRRNTDDLPQHCTQCEHRLPDFSTKCLYCGALTETAESEQGI